MIRTIEQRLLVQRAGPLLGIEPDVPPQEEGQTWTHIFDNRYCHSRLDQAHRLQSFDRLSVLPDHLPEDGLANLQRQQRDVLFLEPAMAVFEVVDKGRSDAQAGREFLLRDAVLEAGLAEHLLGSQDVCHGPDIGWKHLSVNRCDRPLTEDNRSIKFPLAQ